MKSSPPNMGTQSPNLTIQSTKLFEKVGPRRRHGPGVRKYNSQECGSLLRAATHCGVRTVSAGSTLFGGVRRVWNELRRTCSVRSQPVVLGDRLECCALPGRESAGGR